MRGQTARGQGVPVGMLPAARTVPRSLWRQVTAETSFLFSWCSVRVCRVPSTRLPPCSPRPAPHLKVAHSDSDGAGLSADASVTSCVNWILDF